MPIASRRRAHAAARVVTIKDVAREAAVSVATVSRVYNDSANVRDDTRERVRRVGARLGYSPHGGARSLITRTTHTVGVLLPDLYGEFFSELIRGIDQTVQAHGYHLLVASSHDAPVEIEAALRSMRGRVDGLIVMSPTMDAQKAVRHLAHHFPVVLLNCTVRRGAENDGAELDAITIANFQGARAMVRHLAQLGHRRIAIIGGSPRNFDAAERLRGYRAALREAALERVPEWEVHGDFGERSGHQAARALLRLEPCPSAIFAANDAMAIGALSALREAKVRVPQDVAVVGFDDIPMARYMNPPLTTVHVDIGDLGQRATQRLIGRLNGTVTNARQQTVSASLVVRSSCGGEPPS
jgi:LacI family transcriptional regulator